MKITLKTDGKESIHVTSDVTARFYRKLLEFDKTIDYSNMGIDEYDEIIGFICDVFDNKFTVDEFWDGILSYKLNDTILDVFHYVRTGEIPKEKDEAGNETGK